MQLSVYPEAFTIKPPDDLLEIHPTVRSLSKQLAIRYANREPVSDEMLQQVGSALWSALDIDAAFEQHCCKSGTYIVPISITSDTAELLQLPWETLHHPQHGFLALQTRFALSRQLQSAPKVDLPPQPGPLRVLLLTAMTEDQQRLDVEEEQAQIQEALLPMLTDGLVELQMPNDGRFNTFKQTLQSFQPHVLFLSGHGKYHDQSLRDDQHSYAEFLFESEGLDSQAVKGSDLAQAFFGTAVQCVVLSACESGQSASDQLSSGLMHQLSLAGIPHVIGMRESIFDVAATRFNRRFCDAIAEQQRVDVALQHAREAISQPLTGQHTQRDTAQTGELEQSYGQWCLPILLSSNPSKALIDWQFQPQLKQQPQQQDINQAFQQLSLPQRFIGRRRELRDLENTLGSPALSKLLITGPGGQGKTALTGHLAQHLMGLGRKTLVWSANASASDAVKVNWRKFQFELEFMLDETRTSTYQRYVAQCDNRQQQIEQLLKLLADNTPQGLLLVFDNLETLQDPQSRQITDLETRAWIDAASVQSNARLCVLLTSRWQLPDWSKDQHWPLQQLSYNDYLQLARQLKLPAEFLHNRQRIRQLHNTLHGNARGLTFFAAAIQNMDSQQEDAWLAQLAEAKAELQIDMALQTVYDQRSPEQRELLQRLAVYQTPVAVEGVIKLALDLAQAQRLLDELLAVSLLEQTWQHDWQCLEYQLPATVRDWLANNSKQPPTRPTQELAASYQLYLFRYERDTVQQAINAHDALRLAEQDHAADRLVLDVIVGPLNRRGLFQTLLDIWLPKPCKSQDPQTRSDALNQYGKQYLHIGNYDTALSYLKQSLAIQQDIGDKSGEGTTLNNISQIYKARGDYDTALSYLKQSLAIRQDIGDKSGEGTTLNNIGENYRVQGDYDTALIYLKQSLAITQDIGDKSIEGTTLNNLASTAHAKGDYDTALSFLKQSLAIKQDIGDKSGEGTTHNNISLIYLARGDYDTALSYLKQSLAITQDIGNKSGEGTTLNNISEIYKARGDSDTALSYLKQSLAIQQDIGDKSGEGTTLNNISQIYDAKGDYDTALSFLKQSLAIRQDIGDTAGLCVTLFNMGHIHLQNEEKEQAIMAWVTVYRLAKPMQLAQVLQALEGLTEQLGLAGGLDAWEALAAKFDGEDSE